MMDIALATVTVISLTMAFAMGIVTWRLTREERRRGDARVAKLMAELDAAPLRNCLNATQDRPHGLLERPTGRTVGLVERTVKRRPAASAVPEAQSRVGLSANSSPEGLRSFLVTVAAAIAVLATVSFGLPPQRSEAPVAAPGAVTPEPVELLSLAHATKGDSLAVTGSIRNPSDGIERGPLSVTAIVFDRDGTVVATAQTPLPVAVLPPGSETPFSVSLPDAGQINRYRISFMQGQTTVPHIDRRRPSDQTRSAVSAPTEDHP